MATQPSTESFRPQLLDGTIVPAERRDDGPQRQIDRAARLAATLLHAPSGWVYARRIHGNIRIAGPPAGLSCGGISEAAGRTATEVLRSSGAVVGSVDRSSFQRLPPDSASLADGRDVAGDCIGVPVLSEIGGAVGALVVADTPGRRWNAGDLANLRDLAALLCGELNRASGPAAAPNRSFEERVSTEPPSTVGTRGRSGVASPPRPADLFSEAGDAALAEIIRQSIVGSLHLGGLRAGDRLPSIRQTARAFSVTPYMVLQAYAELELEGLVERRERSGIFVADFDSGVATSLPETGAWLTEVLTQACQHQVKIPLLPDLIRRWTHAGHIRCACLEDCFDSRFSLAVELSQQFGIQASTVSAEIPRAELEDTDLVITTAYHAARIGPLLAEARKPMLIATINPLILSSALNHLRERDLTVICVDRVYGARLRALQGGAYRDRVHVVTTDDTEQLAALDRSEAVLLTPAARQQLSQPDFRLVAPVYPAYSLDFARKVAESLVRINLSGSRA